MHHNIIHCDKCGQEIRTQLQTKTIDNDIQIVYFTCTQCDSEYFCYATNEASRKLQRKIKREFNYTKKKKLIERHAEIIQELNALYKEG
jgi:hypothetical protein